MVGLASADAPDPDVITAAAVAGDVEAFEALYRLNQSRLLRYATGLVGRDAEDVTAEAWLQIARDLRRFSGDADGFRAWAARIVRNRALDQIRARTRRPVVSVDIAELIDPPGSDDVPASVEETMSTETALALIAELPRDQAEAVLLRVVVGLDAAATGEILGKRAGAVRVAAHRGLRTLQRRLTENEAGPGSARDLPGRERRPAGGE
ncbi:MAG: RNA polymerase sigma factor [Actinobacteria bacterium]|nr:RNA polymerase sigma factor [Actinomycetota bacterium]